MLPTPNAEMPARKVVACVALLLHNCRMTDCLCCPLNVTWSSPGGDVSNPQSVTLCVSWSLMPRLSSSPSPPLLLLAEDAASAATFCFRSEVTSS